MLASWSIIELYFAFKIIFRHSIAILYLTLDMSSIASSSLRQASRLCAKQISSAGLIRTATVSRVLPVSAQKISRRRYVSETKKDNAQVNVETAIMPDQKPFFTETSKLPENQPMRGTTTDADVMMSPIAGILDLRCFILRRC